MNFIRSFPQLSHALCFFYQSERDLFSEDRAYFPRTFSYVTIHSCYTSRVSIPAVLRDRTTVINPRIFPVGQTPGIHYFEYIFHRAIAQIANYFPSVLAILRCKIYSEKQRLNLYLYFYFSKKICWFSWFRGFSIPPPKKIDVINLEICSMLLYLFKSWFNLCRNRNFYI